MSQPKKRHYCPYCGEETHALTFAQLQAENEEWSVRNFGKDVEPHWPMIGAMEELGELAHAVLKMHQGIRGENEEHIRAAKDAVGDIIIYLADYCTRSGFDLEQVVRETWDRVRKRDWKKDPQSGGEAKP